MIKAPRKTNELAEDRRKHAPVHEWISVYGYLTDNVFLTKNGDLFSVLKIRGVDTECLDTSAVELICQRYETALRSLGPEYRLYEYLIKRDSPVIPAPVSSDPLEHARAEWLEERKTNLYTVDLYLVVLRMRPAVRESGSLMSKLSMRASLALSRKELQREIHALTIACESLSIQLAGVFAPEVLSTRDAVRFLRGIVNLDPSKVEPFGTIPEIHLDQYLSRSWIDFWEHHLKMDDYFIRILSMIDQPQFATPHLLRKLLTIPTNMIICSEWNRIPNDAMNKQIDTARLHYHNAITSAWSYVAGRDSTPQERLKDGSKQSAIEVFDKAKEEMLLHENHFGNWNYSIALFDKSELALRKAVAAVTEPFSSSDARLIEEQAGLTKAWASMIPGGYTYALHPQRALNQTHALLSPAIFAPAHGLPVNTYWNKPALGVLETEEATLFHLNTHYGQLGHALMLGASDAGKSFTCNFLVSTYQKEQPYTVIFDLGGSYRSLTKHYGGSYLHVGQEGNTFTINPFSLPFSRENHSFLFDFVRVLIEKPHSTLTEDERRDLYKRIADLYCLEPDMRQLSTLAKTVHKTYRSRFNEWVDDGRFAKYFDHVEDNLTFANFQTFDFRGMDKPEVIEPVLFYILHRANTTIYDQAQANRPKLIVFDEAWKFFTTPQTRNYIHEGLKTGRKHNWAVLLATQSLDDLVNSQLLPSIQENCLTRFFLASPGLDSEAYRKTFGLNVTEAEILKRLIPRKQFLFKRPDMAKILNLNVDKLSHRIFANQEQHLITEGT